MKRDGHARWRVPAVMAVAGTAIAVAELIGGGWGAALSVEIITIGATVGYYLIGGRDSDAGAIFGSRADERQSDIDMRATAFAGTMMTVLAIVGFVVTTAMRATAWPFALFGVVGGLSYLAGQYAYRNRSRADA